MTHECNAASVRQASEIVIDAHRQHLAGMHLVWRMAKYGPGPDTPPETTLETIWRFAEKRIRSIEAQLPDGYYEDVEDA
jgi:hypothetical protein